MMWDSPPSDTNPWSFIAGRIGRAPSPHHRVLLRPLAFQRRACCEHMPSMPHGLWEESCNCHAFD